MKSCYWEKGLSFSCTQCSKCCRFEPGLVFLSADDLKRLHNGIDIPKSKFIEKYCRWIAKSDGYEYLSLIEKPNNDCIFWDSGCTVYEHRPLQCSAYPFWPDILADEKAWDDVVCECPGAGKGSVVAPVELLNLRIKQSKQPHIRRKMYQYDS